MKNCKKIEIMLIEAPDISAIGVGEATIPSIINFLHFLGINEQNFMCETEPLSTWQLNLKTGSKRVLRFITILVV